MDLNAAQGLRVRGRFEVRSGKCPQCDTTFDDSEHEPRDDKRFCPKCKEYRLGKLKQSGGLKVQP